MKLRMLIALCGVLACGRATTHTDPAATSSRDTAIVKTKNPPLHPLAGPAAERDTETVVRVH